jgi:predicted NUDIX family NTP pyrophosphohydrolase
MVKQSAGILLYRERNNEYEVFLIHPGGPLWKNKEKHAWSIPKGEFDNTEKAIEAALREFKEETGYELAGEFVELTPVKQHSGKIVFAFAQEKDLDETKITSNLFEMEWPPKSGKTKHFPEADKAGWFEIEEAKEKIFKGQENLLYELEDILNETK